MTDVSNLIQQGNKAFASKSYKKAQKFYERALKLEPESQTVIFNLGVAYQALGILDQAALCYENVKRIADAKNNLGVIYENQGELERAGEAYKAALEVDKNYSLARENLGRLNRRINLKSGLVLKKTSLADFPADVLMAIRKSFAYRGLLKAFENKIISFEDIKAEAELEEKNVDLPGEQRVHSVLLKDIEKVGQGLTGLNKVEQSLTKSGKIRKPDVNKVNKVVNKVDKDESLDELQEKFGKDFGPGWKGRDKDGGILEILDIKPDQWILFKYSKMTGESDTYTQPMEMFIYEFKEAKFRSVLDFEDILVKPEELAKLSIEEKIELINKIHKHTMERIKALRKRQRELIEQVLKKIEAKKLEQVLEKIKGE